MQSSRAAGRNGKLVHKASACIDAINDNILEMIERRRNNSRKITENIYIDNRIEKRGV